MAYTPALPQHQLDSGNSTSATPGSTASPSKRSRAENRVRVSQGSTSAVSGAASAMQVGQRSAAATLYDRILAMPLPDRGGERVNYLRAMNNACIAAHAIKEYSTAVRIADRAQPIAYENPYIYHSAACAYAAVGDYAKALQQVRLAIEHGYDHVQKVEVDSDLGALLEWPEFKALFRDWHARQEGN